MSTHSLLSASLEDIHHTISLKNHGNPAVFEMQGQAPSPDNTYFHIAVFDKFEDDPSTSGLVLTAFPRKRMSETWHHDSNLNPSEREMSLEDFMKGDFKRELVTIFGEDKYEKLHSFVKELTEKEVIE